MTAHRIVHFGPESQALTLAEIAALANAAALQHEAHMNQLDPTTPLLVTLQARQWNGLLAVADAGLNALAVLIGDVQRQCMQASAAPPPEAEHISAPRQHAAPRPN